MLNTIKKGFLLFALAGALFAGTAILSCSNSANSLAPEKKSSDWLFVLYLDGESNLNDDYWQSLYQSEFALADMRNDDDTPKTGYPSVNIVVLWDGISEGHKDAEKCTRFHPDAALFELGRLDDESKAKATEEFKEGYQGEKPWRVSKNTKDLTSSVTWLETEPDMGDVKTLTKFLTWVNSNYSATYTMLCLGDHGSGTEYETKSGSAFAPALSLCNDATNKTADKDLNLSAVDVKQALADSGLKPNILWMDACFQGNVETAYLLRGTADYLVTSANSSYSHDYCNAMDYLNIYKTPELFGKAFVREYAELFKGKNMTDIRSDANHTSFESVLTMAEYSLDTSKQEALYDAIGALAKALNNDGNDVLKAVYENYIYQDFSNKANCKGAAYPGTYTILNDIGYFCWDLIDANDKAGQSDATVAAAKAVRSCLNDVIITSWVGKFDDTDKIFYKKNLDEIDSATEVASDGDNTFGLTIATRLQVYSDATYNDSIPIYKDYEGVTGYHKEWGELISNWYTLAQ